MCNSSEIWQQSAEALPMSLKSLGKRFHELSSTNLALIGCSSLLLLFRSSRRKVVLSSYLPILVICELYKLGLGLAWKVRHLAGDPKRSSPSIDESSFPTENEFNRILSRIGDHGPRTTGSKVHNDFIGWIEEELREIPGLQIRTDEFEIQRWQTLDGRSLQDAGQLIIGGSHGSKCDVPVAGVVPFSKITSGQSGELVYIPRNQSIQEVDVAGKIVLRDFPSKPIPYALGSLPSYHKTSDLFADFLSDFSTLR